MMQDHLHFTAEVAAKEVGRQGDAHVSFTKLKRRYEELVHRCNQLIEPDTEEEHAKLAEVRIACIKAFLLLLLGYTIFAGKNNRSINLLWLSALQDMDDLSDWAWGAMGLAFLYVQLSLTSDSYMASCGGYMTLFVVIIVFLILYLLDRKFIVVCIILVLI
jgi:hypothetical protein